MTERRRVFSSGAGALALVALLAIGLGPARAQGQGPANEAAETQFEQGVKRYNLGRFAEAITAFERAYDADPAPILLFNIAQSHRQMGNKERALFFYRRYVEQAPDAPNRTEVEQRMKDLAQSLEQEKDSKQRPPTEVARPDGSAPTVTTVTEANIATTAAPLETTAGTSSVPRWAVLAYVAPSFASVSGQPVEIPTQLSLRLGGAYAFPLPSARLTVGLDGVLSFIPYTMMDNSGSHTSNLPGLLATAAYLYDVTPTISIGGGVGAGVVWWTGLRENSVLTTGLTSLSGPFLMPTFEAELRATWALRSDLFLVLAPEIIYSKPMGGLDGAISALWRFDINVGAGYRF